MNSVCDICKNNAAQSGNLLTTTYWKVMLAPDQGYLGRCYVTLLDHKEHLSELSEAEWQDYASIVKKLENACKRGLGASLANWSCLMNNAYQQKPYNPHVHWHFRPRYESPTIIEGTTFEDPEFGFHYNRTHKRLVDAQLFEAIASRIKTYLR